MDKIFNWTSTVIGIVGGFFAAIFGQWDSILWALLVIMVLDYLTGIIKAVYTKTMSSEIGFKGLLKKITILIIVALSNVLQQITGDNVAIREIVIMFYTFPASAEYSRFQTGYPSFRTPEVPLSHNLKSPQP